MNRSPTSWLLINIAVDVGVMMIVIHWSTLKLMMICRRRPMILIAYWSRLMMRMMNLRRRLERNAQRKIRSRELTTMTAVWSVSWR